jgi:FAD/FMN-containing dehydrogenase
MGVLRKICLDLGGKETENTIPKVIRTNPFTPLNNILGPGGERWAPVHGIVPHSKALAAYEAVEAAFDKLQPEFDALGVTRGYMLTTLSTNGFLIEPVFFWPEDRFEIHDQTLEPSFLAKLPKLAPNPAASELVERARTAVKEVFLQFGGTHFQIGKTYPYREGRMPEAWALLEAIKSAVDPQRRVNPGSLGLD